MVFFSGIPLEGKKSAYFLWDRQGMIYLPDPLWDILQDRRELIPLQTAFLFDGTDGLLHTGNGHMESGGNFGIGKLKGRKAGDLPLLLGKIGNDLTAGDLTVQF